MITTGMRLNAQADAPLRKESSAMLPNPAGVTVEATSATPPRRVAFNLVA